MKNELYNISSDTYEEFSIKVLTLSYDSKYSNFIYHGKDDEFDYTSSDDDVALEVVSIIPDNIINAVKYENAMEKGKKPDSEKVLLSKTDSDGNLIMYYGGSIGEIKQKIKDSIQIKKNKTLRRKKYKKYKLCICIHDGGLLSSKESLYYLLKDDFLKNMIYDKVFFITRCNFYVWDRSYQKVENQFQEYKRIIN